MSGPDQGLVDDVRRVLSSAPGGSPEARFEREAWSALLERVGPALLTRERAPSHLTASAAVLSEDGTQTCLILHRKVGLWLQPGGHIEGGDASLAEAAAREAGEETGLSGVVRPEPVLLSRHPAPCAPGVVDWHLDVQFVLVASADQVPRPSDETPQVAWWPVDALPPDRAGGVDELVAAARAAL
ncbi:NUDIX hydrolase [Spongisporangium articulatum]|uniref:NUDIX hydrolase n=1 Tax=Spongisporangium articulatum TaxID=3362603 RepID=A0ABW8AQR6_9ACTN